MDGGKILKKLHQNLDWSLRGACDGNPQAAVALKLVSDSILSVMKECESEKGELKPLHEEPVNLARHCDKEVSNQQIVFVERRQIKENQQYEEVYVTIGRCPTCRGNLKCTYHPNYCGDCGQAVKWTRY